MKRELVAGDRVKQVLDFGGAVPVGTIVRAHEKREGWYWVQWPWLASGALRMAFVADLEWVDPARVDGESKMRGDS